MGLFDNRIDLQVDYFNNKRKDILLQRNTVSNVTGFQQMPWQNFGIVKNQGVDASLNLNYKVGEVNLSARGNFTFARNEILCVGVNYRDHREEAAGALADFKAAPEAVYFAKRAIRILGSGEAIEARLDLDDQLDYEVELAVIIGKEGKDIPREKAEEYIFGYSIFNDISSRKLQNRHGQWFRGKSLDTYSAMGPVILHKSALPFPVEVDVRSYVNGEKRQDSNTRLFLADIPKIIEDLSKGMTLEPGDIIATGTPAGVGMGSNPPRFMKQGDEVICEIPPIGRLVNRVETYFPGRT